MASNHRARERRQRILDRAAQVGDDQAATEAGITIATLRKWRGDEAEPAQPTSSERDAPAADVEPGDQPDADAQQPRPLDDLDRMRQAATAARIVATRAIRRTNEMLDAGRASDARNAAAAGGIWADKAAKWDELIAQAEQRREQLADEVAQQLADRMRLFVEALGLSIEHPAIRELVRAALLGKVSPATGAAARAVLRPPSPRPSPRPLPEARQLPAPSPHPDAAEVDEAEPMAGPRRIIKATRERRQRRAKTRGDVVDGEVVDEPRRTKRGQAGVEEVAAQVGDRVDVFRFGPDGELIDPERPRW